MSGVSAKNEYTQAGVDYTKIEPFKRAMVATGKRTLKFPLNRDVWVECGEHGSYFYYTGSRRMKSRKASFYERGIFFVWQNIKVV